MAATRSGWEARLERNVRFRLGRYADTLHFLDLKALSAANISEIPSLHAVDGATKLFLDWNGILQSISRSGPLWLKAVPGVAAIARSCAFLNYVAKLAIDADFLINFADAQNRNYREVLTQRADVPVFQYNRLRDRDDVILFPLLNYMEVGGPNSPDRLLHDVPWTGKLEKAIWRGAFSGFRFVDGRVELSYNTLSLLSATNGKRESFDAVLSGFPRYLLARLARANRDVDANLIGWERLPPGPQRHPVISELIKPLFGEPMPVRDQLRYKYLICLEGFDCPTSLFWGLASNSVVLMPPPNWHNIFHESLSPWEHYVPINEDLSDLENKIAWCRDHDSEAAEISRRADEYIAFYQDRSSRNILDSLTIERYARSFSKCGRFCDVQFGAPVTDVKLWRWE
jgi:hypothetical protein